MPLVKVGEVAEYYNVSTQTIRHWTKSGKISATKSLGGTRLYDLDILKGIKSPSNAKSGKVYTKYFYCRVSSAKQADDLERQITFAKENYPEHQIVKDIGSGLNWRRKGLRKILEDCNEGEVEEVRVFHRDRLCRFGFELLEYIIGLNGAKLLVHQQIEQSKQEELAEDLLSIIHVFSCSQNGRRRYKDKKDKILPDNVSEEDLEELDE